MWFIFLSTNLLQCHMTNFNQKLWLKTKDCQWHALLRSWKFLFENFSIYYLCSILLSGTYSKHKSYLQKFASYLPSNFLTQDNFRFKFKSIRTRWFFIRSYSNCPWRSVELFITCLKSSTSIVLSIYLSGKKIHEINHWNLLISTFIY